MPRQRGASLVMRNRLGANPGGGSISFAKSQNRTYTIRMNRAQAGHLGQLASLATRAGQKKVRMKKYYASPTECKFCSGPVEYLKAINGWKYCNRKCRGEAMVRPHPCAECGSPIVRKFGVKYCSKKCRLDFGLKKRTKLWLDGKTSGGYWDGVKDFVRQWLIKTRGNRCELCGWEKVHPVTGRIPVQIDHVDGDPYNHRPENLKLLCPNCHSLTPSFGGLNRGKGRKERRGRLRNLIAELV